MQIVRSCVAGDGESVASLVLNIQNGEYNVGLGIEEQPDLLNAQQSYFTPGGHFWVSQQSGGTIVGCIGIQLAKGKSESSRFFLHPSNRGAASGYSESLFDTLVTFAKDHGLLWLMLDSPAVATRSHVFYRRKGFVRVEYDRVPVPYPFFDRDSHLYPLRLTGSRGISDK